MAMGFSQQQKATQIQAQRMSQKQIQSLNLLSMNAADLREEIFKQLEKNPALEIVSDNFESGVKSARYKNLPGENIRTGVASSLGEQKSEAFQEILESRPDERKSLFLHLTEQINMLTLDQAKKRLCKKIIANLDSRGFYILAPSTLVDKRAGESQKLLEECVDIVQNLDPPGICVENVEKSLLLQAKLKGGSPRLALFLLDGHLDFLNPPQGQKVLEKIEAFLAARKKLSFAKEDFSFLESVSEDDVDRALYFIRSLDPFPARDFSQEETHYVAPDIYVEKVQEEKSGLKEGVDYEKRSVSLGADSFFRIRISDKAIPQIRIAPDFGPAQKNSGFAKAAINQAKMFLEGLEYRENTIAKAACAIVQKQIEFFKNGPGNIVPLKQKDIAALIGVHESTVSRMASSKYLQCQWGVFPIKHFFSSAVADVSKESAQYQIQKLLEENPQKKWSDQKLAAALAERGIKIARRTVAKYRSQMNIESSYLR